jgi:hypothetical protein
MALDVHVMPLWRFKAGDFTSPIEKNLGIKPTVISLEDVEDDPPPPPPPWYLRLLAKLGVIVFEDSEPELTAEEKATAARERVDELKIQLSELTGTPIDWTDAGEIHYSKQFFHPVTLRAFAAWCNLRDALPEFVAPPQGDYYRHPVWKLAKPPHLRFSTLIGHGLHTGYFIPVPFEGVHLVEPFMVWDRQFHHQVASTQTIMRELAELLPMFEEVGATGAANQQTPAALARWYAGMLQEVCSLSIEHGLPVIFHG